MPITGKKAKIRVMIFVNFKTYQSGTGKRAVELAKICQKIEKQTSVKIIPVVQAVDIFQLAGLGIEVWAQHVDDIESGANTGQVLPEAISAAGAKGTILNHSENKLPIEVIGSTIKNLKLKIENFRVLVCAESIEEGREIAKFKPDFIAYEPPELIGGNISVSTAKPEVIRDFVIQVADISVIVGAGVHNQTDIRKGLELGAEGFLVSSDMMLAEIPQKELIDLAEGFK